MTDSIRPVVTFVLRMWHEPGAPEGDAGWRGLVRPLDAEAGGVHFQGMDDLSRALRQLLAQEDISPSRPQYSPEPDVRG
jgi:hypothetical protein